MAGMRPPSEWTVHGAFDLVGGGAVGNSSSTAPVKLESRAYVQHTNDILNGAIHGVTNVWTDETLEEIRDLMHSDRFWLYRKHESFIRAFGGPYVLGQKQEDLSLVLGGRHNELTSRICTGHNLVYTAVNLEFPASPGFNTLIFGLNLLGSGFHYHQDSIAELPGKNAPLLPKQPVVTTVFYEKEEDTGKETVFWKPKLNFCVREESTTASRRSSLGSRFNMTSAGLYLAARALPTQHGQIHVQRAGLQSDTLHGIFHTPLTTGSTTTISNTTTATCNDDEKANHGGVQQEKDQDDIDIASQLGPRTGYRVAITARIAYPDSNERLIPYLGLYQGYIGPEGNLTLP